MESPIAVNIPTQSHAIHGSNPVFHVYQAVTGTPRIGVSMRNPMLIQSFCGGAAGAVPMKPPFAPARGLGEHYLILPGLGEQDVFPSNDPSGPGDRIVPFRPRGARRPRPAARGRRRAP